MIKNNFYISAKFINELKILIILIIIAFTVKNTLVEVYIVPTGSMENTILTGDMLIGNKFVYGMRTPLWIGIPYTRIGFYIPWFRLPKFKEVQNGDVTIFEFPRDPFQKYVKRCIGIPKDTIFSKNREIFVNENKVEFPLNGKHINSKLIPEDKIQSSLWTYFKGNMDNIDSFIVPYKGMEINLMEVLEWQSIITILVQDGNNVSLAERNFTVIDPSEIARMHGFLKYKILGLFKTRRGKQELKIREQTDRYKFVEKLIIENRKNNLINPWQVSFSTFNDKKFILDNLMINGVPASTLKTYKVKRDYYFFMGDNRDNSYDSRFWGFVPDYQVLGNPVFSVINIFNFNRFFSNEWNKFLRFMVIK